MSHTESGIGGLFSFQFKSETKKIVVTVSSWLCVCSFKGKGFFHLLLRKIMQPGFHQREGVMMNKYVLLVCFALDFGFIVHCLVVHVYSFLTEAL